MQFAETRPESHRLVAPESSIQFANLLVIAPWLILLLGFGSC